MARLRLLLLGPFAAFLDDKPIAGFESARVRALLAYLAAEKARPHPRAALVELFWPEQPSGVGSANLRHALANLRKAIGDQAATPPFLLITPVSLQLNPDGDVAVDLDRFCALLADDVAPPAAPPAAPVAPLEEALALYRGRFLEGLSLDGSPDFELWMTMLAERVDYLARQALARLVRHAVQQADFAQAVRWTQRQLELDPVNEDVHVQLVWLLAHSGQRAAALHQVDLCRLLLQRDLGVEPQEALQTLAAAIRTGSADLGVVHGQDGRPLVAPPSSIPMPPSAAVPLVRLPAPATPFIGRQRELALVAERLADPTCRLLTIVGAGGMGKTRLAIQAAAAARDHFAHGVRFVELTSVATPDQAPTAILAGLDAPHLGAEETRRQLLDFMQPRHLLLVLDNFEHLLDGAGLLAELLLAAPRLKLLVTSRVRLNLREEWLIPLEGLELPPEKPLPVGTVESSTHLEDYDAPRFFLQCARRLQPEFAATSDDAAAVVHLCRLLAGMPLGIELAATWVRALPLPAIAGEIERSLAFLTTSMRDMPDRHRSMSAVFDQSWRLLSPRQRSLLRQMSVFRGGCTAEAAEAVAGATLADLAGLVDASWLRLQPDARYTLHELVRQYCEERLEADHAAAADGESGDQVRSRHCTHYAAAMQRALQKMNYRQEVLPEVMAENGNLLAALRWSAVEGNVDAASRMIVGLAFLAEALGWYQSVLQTYEAAAAVLATLTAANSDDAQWSDSAALIRCWLCWRQGILCRHLGRLERGSAHIEQLSALVTQVRPSVHQRWLSVMGCWAQALFAYLKGDLPEVHLSFQETLTRLRADDFPALFYSRVVEPKFFQAQVHHLLGEVAWRQGDYAAARQRLQLALALGEETGEQRYRAMSLVTLAGILRTVGEYAQAKRCVQQALHLSQTVGDEITHACARVAAGQLAREEGAVALAVEHCQASLVVGRQSGHHRILMESLIELGRIELACGQPAEATRWFQEAITAFVRLETTHSNYVAGALLGLGWAALASHEPASANQYFHQVLAAHGRTAWEAMEATIGLAQIAAGAAAEAAVRALALVVHHPATAHATRAQAGQLLSQLEQALPAGVFAENVALGWPREPGEVVGWLGAVDDR